MTKIWRSIIGFLGEVTSRYRRVTGVVLALLSLGAFASASGVLISTVGSPPGLDARFIIFNVAAIAALWLFLVHILGKAPPPVHAFWQIFLAGVLAALLSAFTLRFIPGGFTEEGTALNIPTAISMSLLMVLAITFCFVLVQRFRALIHYRRTSRSLFLWRLLLAIVVVAVIILAGLDTVPESAAAFADTMRAIVVAAVVILMAINCFRLSWIVRLSFGEKLITMLLALALLVLFGVVQNVGPSIEIMLGSRAVASEIQGNEGYFAYLHAYSAGMTVIVQFTGLFGVLYSLTAILSLLFHLPTTGDFKRRQDEITAMQGLTGLVQEVFDSDKLLRTITASPIEAGSASASWLVIADAESGSLEPQVVAAEGIARDLISRIDVAALYEEVRRTDKPVLLQRAPSDRRVTTRMKDGVASLLAVPLSARHQVLGALFVVKKTTEGFEHDDVSAVRMYAAQAALALENARLFEEQVRNERLARELAIAREIQRKLLPDSAPHVPGLAVAAASLSAYEVGGDYHDWAKLPDDRIAFIVADVSGKGTSAAFYMAELRGAFNALVQISPDPKEALTQINRALWQSLDRNIFITAIYGLVDTRNASISIAEGGSLPRGLRR